MTDSQIPSSPNSSRVNPLKKVTRVTRWLIISLMFGLIVTIAVFFSYRSLLHVYPSPDQLEAPPTGPDCSYTPEYSPANFEAELEKNRSKWDSAHITHYRMSLTLPFGSSTYDRIPLTIEVKGGEVISVVDARGETVSPSDVDFVYDSDKFTIPGLFSYANQTYLDAPPLISVSYDPTFGYPETIYVDPYVEPCCQDFTYEVRNFEVLP